MLRGNDITPEGHVHFVFLILYKVLCTLYVSYLELSVMYTLFSYVLSAQAWSTIYSAPWLSGNNSTPEGHVHFVFLILYKVLCTLYVLIFN